MLRNIFAAGLIMGMTQASYALSVSSQGEIVLIRDAVSASGVKAQIHLLETTPDGRSRLVPIEQTEGISYKLTGRDLRINVAAANGRYSAVSIERQEQGNRQSMRVSIGGNSSSNSTSIVQRSSGGASNIIAPVPKSVEPQSASKPRSGQAGSWLNKKSSNQDYSNQSFAGSAVVNSKFESDRFYASSFSGASLTNAKFNRCELKRVNFQGSQMVNVKFLDSNLSTANFNAAQLVNVSFKGSDLSGAIWLNGEVCKPGSIGECKL